MRAILFILPFVLINLTYANIREIPVYPSGITVSFNAPGRKPAPLDLNTLPYWERRKAQKEIKRIEKIAENTPIKPVPTRRFIRVINSIALASDEKVALVFFDSEGKKIEQNVINSSPKPSPAHVFYMDRNTGRQFKGLLDVYYIPENAVSMNVAILDTKDKIKKLSTHPAYSFQKNLSIKDYQSVGGNSKIMFQFELLGSSSNLLTRIAAFRFF